MDRAKSSLQNVTDPKAIVDSLNLVFARFSKCLDATGVKQMEVLGEPFDPRLHEPVQEVETNEYPDGAVALELRRGYVYKDKVLRPALVNVASNPSGVVVPKAAPAAVAPKEDAPAAEVAATAAPTTAVPTTAAPIAAAPTAAAPITPAPAAAAPATEAPAPAAPATTTPTPEAVASPPANEVPPSPPAGESAKVQDATQSSSETKSESPGEPPAKKAIDKLKPTRTHTETQDLPVFNIEDISESLTADAESGLVGEPKPAAAGGTIYDISDVDMDDKPGAVDVTSDQ
jgi:hypothetical protein